MEKLFWGRVPIEQATALFYFQKGSHVQHLVHQLKYKGRWDAGVKSGRMLGQRLKQSGRFESLHGLIPVPIHRKKLRRRGYNQCEAIAEGLALETGLPVFNDQLIRNSFSQSQTRKKRYARWENVSEIFDLSTPDTVRNKHLLLVDDVVTTGATLEACATALKQVEGVTVSIATMAVANIG